MCPEPLGIGHISSRRGFVRLSTWFFRTFRMWQPKPVSVPQMLALQAARGDLVRYFVVLARVLRAVLPYRWWYRFTGDPVRLAMRIGLPRKAGGFDDPELQAKVLHALITAPGTDRDMTQEQDTDPLAAIRAQQRAAMHGTSRGPEPSLAHMAAAVRHAYGDAWYFDPRRWPTSDGYAPFALCMLEYVGLRAIHARATLTAYEGHALVTAKDSRAAVARLTDMVLPMTETRN